MEKSQEKKTMPAEQHAFQAIVEGQTEGVVILDRQNIIQYLNPAAKEFLALDSGQVFPHPYRSGKTKECDIPSVEGIRVVSIHAIDFQWQGVASSLITIKDVTAETIEGRLVRQALDSANRRAAELEAVKFVADHLSQTAMLEEAIQAGLEAILPVIAAQGVWILTMEENQAVRLLAIFPTEIHAAAETRHLNTPPFCLGWEKLIRGELNGPTLINDPGCAERMGFKIPLPDTTICVPLGRKKHPLGLLSLAVSAERKLDESEIDFLITIGSQLSTALEQARPFGENHQVLLGEESLTRLSQAISSALDLPTVLQNVVQLSADLVKADAASLGLLNPSGQTLTFLSNYPQSIGQQNLLRDNSLVWKVLEKGSTLLVDDPKGQNFPEGFASGATHMLLAPIKANDTPLGLLCLYHTDQTKRFTRFDRALVESLGNQAGIAVQNAQLFFEVQQLTLSDPLTRLNNQNSFNNMAIKEVERSWRYKRPLTLLSIDLDAFRQFNEDHGQTSGDEILKAIGLCLADSLRRIDLVCRYENDTFVILLPETEISYGIEVADRLRVRIEKLDLPLETEKTRMTASIGLVGLEDGEMVDLATLLNRSFQSLDAAKADGGNQVRLWKAQ